MLNKIYEFTLDLENATYIPSMEFYKNDTDTSKIEITLKNDYQTLNLEGFTIVCKILKADDLEVQNIVEIVDKENGLIAINLSSQALASVGTNTIQLSIYEGLKRLSSKEFAYTVKDMVIGEEGLVSQNDYALLTQLISSVQSVEDIINSSEVSRVFNEGTRIDNEVTRELQEEARQVLKGQMDSLKVALDSLRASMETLKADVETGESARELSESDRELLKASMETLKSTLESLEVNLNANETTRGLTFNSKIDAIDNKIIDVEARSVAKESLIDDKIIEVENRTLDKEVLVDNKIVEVEGRFVTKESEINTSVNNKIVEANTTITNVNIAKTNTETATTNANTKITETEATRQSIIATINNLVAQFNALAPAESSNAEVQLARTDVAGKTYASLQERLLADNKQQNILYSSVSGTYISSDSVDGYAKNVVIEGNSYQNPALLSDIRSTGTKLSDGRYEIPLLTVGKNLFDGELELGTIGSTGLNEVNTNCIRSKNYIPVSPSLNFFISNDMGYTHNIYFYDSKKNFISMSTINPVPSNAKYLRFRTSTVSIQNNLNAKFQIEVGTVATSFESYKEDKLTILSDVQIEKVGTADRILQLVDKWNIEKNVKDFIPDATKWTIRNDLEKTNTKFYQCTLLTDRKLGVNIICNKFTENKLLVADDVEGIMSDNGNTAIYLRINRSVDLATFLSSNNFLIKYQTTTPTYIPLADDQQIALRTFANKTNILSLCEIEPTIKADVPKSTSASINSITEKLSDVDEELGKIKKLEDATNSTVVTDKDFVNISETANGYLSDVRLEGRTLINLLSKDIITMSSTDYIFTDKGTFKSHYKKGVFTITNHTSRKVSFGIRRISDNGYLRNITVNPNSTLLASINDDEWFRTFIGASVDGWTESNKNELTQLTILTGDSTQAPPNYFEGLKSVGQDVNKIVVSSTKGDGNLENPDTRKLGIGIAPTTGIEYIQPLNDRIPNYIYVSPNTQYTLSTLESASYNFRTIWYYDKNKAPISLCSDNVTTKTFTTPTNCYYVGYSFRNTSDLSLLGLSPKIYMSKGLSAKPIDYQVDKKEILYLDTVDSTWKKPVLRGKWKSGKLIFGDVVEKLADGKYGYRKGTGEVVLNGSETGWVVSTINGNNVFTLVLNDMSQNELLKTISNRYKLIPYSNRTTVNVGEYYSTTTSKSIAFCDSSVDLATFKSSLSTNPITVAYQLATEQIYECTPIDVASYSSETNYYLESGVLSPRSTIKVQNFIGNIINTMKEKISLQEKENQFIYATMFEHETRLALLEGGVI